MSLRAEFISHNRKSKNPPNPSYPNGIDVDLTEGAKVACFTGLPHPAECCGVWVVTCSTCGMTAVVTAAGRPDDPRSVKVACKPARSAA